jgi:lipopolysaccharide export system protein LptA
VEISARTLRVKERQAVFAGNVQTHQFPQNGSEARLRSEVLEVRFADTGSGVENILAAGNITYEQGIVGVTNGPAIYRKLSCRTLTAQGDQASGELSELVADGNVRIEQPGSEASGDKMVYNRGTEILKLMGQPRIEAPQAIYTSQQELVWDNARRTVNGTDYKITFKPETLKRAADSQKIPGHE